MRRWSFSWELFGCALHGHFLVGVGAARVAESDLHLARELNGLRWHRCLRCDAWKPSAIPREPTMAVVPSRDKIRLPLRGPLLRDRFVLRLIAFDRAIHVLVLGSIAAALFVFAGHRSTLQHSYDQIMNALLGSSGGPAALRGLLGRFRRFFLFSPQHLYELGFAATGYAALEAAEMVGLWLTKRWAEYLTFIATSLLLPLEIDELVSHVTVFKIVIFVVNLAVAIYLLFAKRLFGLRGGHRAEEQRRHEASGWAAVEQATVPAPSGAGATK